MSTKTEQTEAVERLREWLNPGDEVQCILRHVSRSGMSRVIQLVKFDSESGRVLALGWNAALALDWRYDREREGVKVGGAGMDMGFHLVYSLSQVLFGDGYALKHHWI